MSRPDIAILNAADLLDNGHDPKAVATWLRAYATQLQGAAHKQFDTRDPELAPAGEPQ